MFSSEDSVQDWINISDFNSFLIHISIVNIILGLVLWDTLAFQPLFMSLGRYVQASQIMLFF